MPPRNGRVGGTRRWPHVLALFLVLSLAACAACSRKGGKSAHTQDNDTTKTELTLFFSTEWRGQLEPCGCTSDPLGDAARVAAYLASERPKRPTLVFDGGSTLYPEPTLDGPAAAENRERGQVMAQVLEHLHFDAAGLGPNDLAAGVAAVTPRRQAANLAPGALVEPPKLVKAGTLPVGVFGVVDPSLVDPGLGATPADAAARTAVETLRGQGARLVVALAHMDRRAARGLARSVPGIDILLIGHGAPEPDSATAPERIGDTWLVQPANRGQTLARLDVTYSGAGPLANAGGAKAAKVQIGQLDSRIEVLGDKLLAWEKSPDRDPAFIATQKQQLQTLRDERAALEKNPTQIPATGSWFLFEQVPIQKSMACQPQVQALKVAYDDRVGQANLAAEADRPAPPAQPGKPTYVGVDECAMCHAKQVRFWNETRHAQAWETLESRNKHHHRDCVSCHVTGYEKPGGSTLAKNELLRDVQCETCHGPGSEHVESDGKALATLTRLPSRDTCFLQCHTPEHSDTFEYTAYLRTITGVGHGEAFRKTLGDGPNGRELRQKALNAAGRTLGAGCSK